MFQFRYEIEQIRSTNIFPVDVFENTFRALRKYFDWKHDQGIMAHNTHMLMCDKRKLLSALEKMGCVFDKKIHIHSNNKEIIARLNQEWNPGDFAEKEGFLFTPMIVFPDEKNN